MISFLKTSVQAFLKDNFFLPIELWFIGFMVFLKTIKLLTIFNIYPSYLFSGVYLLSFILFFKKSFPVILNSWLFQFWFFCTSYFYNLLSIFPWVLALIVCFFIPFFLLSGLAYYVDTDTLLIVVILFIMFATLYNRMQYLFLNPSIEG